MALIDRLLNKPPSFVTRLAFGPFFGKTTGKFLFPFLTRGLGGETMFINWGYEEDSPMGLPLAPANEPNRFCIQLYHRPRPKWISVANRYGRPVAATAAEPHT